jgi:hypothetical protein
MQKYSFPPCKSMVSTHGPARDPRPLERDRRGLAYLVRQAAQRIRTERGCEYCSDPGQGCHVCRPADLMALARYTAQ